MNIMNTMNTMNIELNGEPRATSARTIGELLVELAGNGSVDGMAVAVDGRVVPRSQWDTELTSGARVDVLTAVQGG